MAQKKQEKAEVAPTCETCKFHGESANHWGRCLLGDLPDQALRVTSHSGYLLMRDDFGCNQYQEGKE